MSKNYNDCDIVLELLPFYLDGKTGEESNAFVREHLAGCESCSEVHNLMSADFLADKEAKPETMGKKARRSWRHLSPARKRTLILAAGLLGYLALMIGCVALAFWVLVYR